MPRLTARPSQQTVVHTQRRKRSCPDMNIRLAFPRCVHHLQARRDSPTVISHYKFNSTSLRFYDGYTLISLKIHPHAGIYSACLVQLPLAINASSKSAKPLYAQA